MVTLLIEHAVTDLATWRAAFDRFAQARTQAGVSAHRISQPVDDPAYVLVELDFTDTGRAQRFLAFLKENVWSSPVNAPALVGSPRTRIVTVVESWSQPA
jgi:hypothetical protein